MRERPEEFKRVKESYQEMDDDAVGDSASFNFSRSSPDMAPEEEGVGNDYQEADITGFPGCVNGEKTLFKMEDWCSPVDQPQMVVEGDIDSVCGIFQNFSEVVDAIGPSHSHVMHSLTSPYSADKGSRFSVDSSLCEVPAFVRGDAAKTVPLCWLPNIKVATVPISDWGCEMHIHLYFLGAEKLVGASYFSTLRMGVVNAMFNIARKAIMSVNQTGDGNDGISDSVYTVKKQFERCHLFETPVGRKEWRSNKSGSKNVFSAEAMKVFAYFLQEALNLIADDHPQLDFHKPWVNGIQTEGDRDESLDRGEMVKFANKLKHNLAFTASVAGCKQHFCKLQFHRKVLSPDPSSYVDMVRKTPNIGGICETINQIYDTNYRVGDEDSEDSTDEDSDDQNHDTNEDSEGSAATGEPLPPLRESLLPVGESLPPKHREGDEDSEDSTEEDSDEHREGDEDSEDSTEEDSDDRNHDTNEDSEGSAATGESLPPLDVYGNEYFPEIIQRWLDDTNVAIKKEIDSINNELMSAFRKEFTCNDQAATAAADATEATAAGDATDSRSLWYVDIGTEFRIEGDVNLFTDATKAKEFLKHSLKQER